MLQRSLPEIIRISHGSPFVSAGLGRLSQLAKVDLAKLPAPKSHPDKVRLAAALKQGTSVSNAWLAGRLAMG